MADFHVINDDTRGEGIHQSERSADFKVPKYTVSLGNTAPDYMAADIRTEEVTMRGGSPLPSMRPLSAAAPESFTKRIDAAVASGHATVAHESQLPSQPRLLAQFEQNHQAGRPLFEGVKAYRGTKDPDLSSGTFDAGFKHATPVFEMARGYAQTANANIGVASKSTRGIGMLGEYELPHSTVFHRNFAAEDEKLRSKGLTIPEAEQKLKPLVAEYSGASTPEQKDAAALKIDSFVKTNLYEIALPADQKATRQWVVQYDEKTDRGRLLAHQDRGPLADVMVDVLKERKAAVDEHSAKPFSQYIARGGETGISALESFSPGLQKSLETTSQHIDGKLESLRQDAASVKHTSLSEAIEWRKQEHHDTHISRMTNSGSSIEHGDPVLKSIPTLEKSFKAIEEGAWHQRELPTQTEVLKTLNGGHEASVALDHQRGLVASKAEDVAQASQRFDTLQNARTKAAGNLDNLQADHAEKMNGSFISRSIYKFGEGKAAEAQIESSKTALAALDKKLETASDHWKQERASLTREEAVSANLSAKAKEFETQLQAHKNEDRFGAIPTSKTHNLSSSDWAALAAAGNERMAASQAKIATGLESAKHFNDIASKGIELGMSKGEHRDFSQAMQPKEQMQALKTIMQNAHEQAGINKPSQELDKKGHELNGNDQQKTKARETLSHAM